MNQDVRILQKKKKKSLPLPLNPPPFFLIHIYFPSNLLFFYLCMLEFIPYPNPSTTIGTYIPQSVYCCAMKKSQDLPNIFSCTGPDD